MKNNDNTNRRSGNRKKNEKKTAPKSRRNNTKKRNLTISKNKIAPVTGGRRPKKCSATRIIISIVFVSIVALESINLFMLSHQDITSPDIKITSTGGNNNEKKQHNTGNSDSVAAISNGNKNRDGNKNNVLISSHQNNTSAVGNDDAKEQHKTGNPDTGAAISNENKNRNVNGNDNNNGNHSTHSIVKEIIDEAFIAENNAGEKYDEDNNDEVVIGDDEKFHIIFSTGCSLSQAWQSYVFFYHAMKSGQKGHVTRIASGCKKKEAEDLRELHNKQIKIMSPHNKFHLHFTPSYSKIYKNEEENSYKYFNKPFGVQHWMKHAMGYKKNNESNSNDDYIMVLCDPDQIILRPFTNNYATENGIVYAWRGDAPERGPDNRIAVRHGEPFAQIYGFHSAWRLKTNISAFVAPNESPSPVLDVSGPDGRLRYPAGPPYIATGRDFHNIVNKWVEFVPHVYLQHPHLLAEMFAYCLAAAHLKLPHFLSTSFMFSDISVSGAGESWSSIGPISEDDICYNAPEQNLPHVLHYCQNYMLGKYFISKYLLPHTFLSCESPLLMLPPKNISKLYDYAITPDGKRKEYNKGEKHRMVFMLCTTMKALNDAAVFYKKHNCFDENKKIDANFSETLSLL